MTSQEMYDLQQETGEALLKAIKQAAPSVHGRGLDGLVNLATAYKTTVEGLKTNKQPGT